MNGHLHFINLQNFEQIKEYGHCYTNVEKERDGLFFNWDLIQIIKQTVILTSDKWHLFQPNI